MGTVTSGSEGWEQYHTRQVKVIISVLVVLVVMF